MRGIRGRVRVEEFRLTGMAQGTKPIDKEWTLSPLCLYMSASLVGRRVGG